MYGVQPVDKLTFVLENYTEEERKVMNEEPTNNRNYRNYFRNWLAKKKLDPAWAARKKKKDQEYQRRYSERRKERYKRQKEQKKKAFCRFP